MKILVVEDEQSLRELAVMRLKREGFEVFEADNGKLALQICVQEKPEVVLLDILLPEMNGYDFTTEVRANAAIKDTIIVAVSAKAELIDRRNALEAGVDIYITKPVFFDEVLEEVHKIIKERKK